MLHLHLDRPREYCEHLAAQVVPNSTGTFGLIPLDQRPIVTDDTRHHAPAEAKILSAYRGHCPSLARIDLIDTVRLARNLYPELPRHGLDELLRHLRIPLPPNRHRSMADVQLTTELFIRMATDSDWADLRQLRALAGYAAEAAQAKQVSLFD